MEQCCGPLALEIVPGNTAISALIFAKKKRAEFAA
jgi:hypothetical protein